MKPTRIIYHITTDTHVHTISCPLPDEKTGCERLNYLLRDNLKITENMIDTVKSVEFCFNAWVDYWGEIVEWQKEYKKFLKKG